MKHTNIFAALLGTGSVGLWGLAALTVAPVAQAGNADFCLVAREGKFSGQELYNRCQETVEAAWCHYEDNNCARFDNTWTIPAGQSYPIAKGTVLYAACRGANSIARISRTFVDCE